MNDTYELSLKQLTTQHFVPVGWYQNTFRTDFTMEWHHHQQFEIMYCEKGSFYFEYMRSEKEIERIAVPEKCFILVNTGYYHKISIETDNTQICNVELYPASNFEADDKRILKNLSPAVRELFSATAQLEDLRDKDALFYLFHDAGDIGKTMKELVEELDSSEEPAKSLSGRLLILKLIFDMSKCHTEKNLQSIKLSYVRKAMLFMQKKFAAPLSVENVADAVGISPAYLQRLFKAELKEGIHGTLTKIRVNNAKNLLKTTSLPNQEIAKLSGFSSREQLIYSFRVTEGCSPHEYRLACRSKSMRTFPWPTDTKLPAE